MRGVIFHHDSLSPERDVEETFFDTRADQEAQLMEWAQNSEDESSDLDFAAASSRAGWSQIFAAMEIDPNEYDWHRSLQVSNWLTPDKI